MPRTQRFWTQNPDLLLAQYSNHPIMTFPSVWLLMLQITVWEQCCFRLLMDWNTRSATSAASSGQLNSTTPQPRIRSLADGLWNWTLPPDLLSRPSTTIYS